MSGFHLGEPSASMRSAESPAGGCGSLGIVVAESGRCFCPFREVEDALVAVHKTREQTQAQVAQVTSLLSALELATLRYQGGVANYLDVLIAQQSLFDAELSLTATRRLHLVSIVQLYRALGGGWVPDVTPLEQKQKEVAS